MSDLDHDRALEAAARALCLCDDPDADALLLSGKPAWTAHIEEARAAVTAYLSEAGNGWRDIETAPKDGTRVLLRIGRKNPLTFIGHQGRPWNDDVDEEGLCWLNDDDEEHIGPVTHWRPLPAPPAAQEKK